MGGGTNRADYDWRQRLEGAATRDDAGALCSLVARVPEGETLDAEFGGWGGATALMLASWYQMPAAAEVLLAAGADPERRCGNGKSALSRGGAGRVRAGADRKRRLRSLLDAYAAGAEAPTLHKVIVGGGTEPERARAMAAASTMMAKRVGYKVFWDTPGGGEVWLRAGERAQAILALLDAAKDIPGVTLDLYCCNEKGKILLGR